MNTLFLGNHNEVVKEKMIERENYLTVTEILGFFTDFSQIPEDKLAAAKARGDHVHEWIKDMILSRDNDIKIGIDDLKEEYRPWGESFLLWWKEDMEVLCIEERFYDDTFQISGKPDLLIRHNGRNHLFDYKTTYAPGKTWVLQLSAYEFLVEQNSYEVDEMATIHLSRLGKEPKVTVYESKWDLFLKHYEVFKFHNGKKRAKKT